LSSSCISAYTLLGKCVAFGTFNTGAFAIVTVAVLVFMALVVVGVLTADASFAVAIGAVVCAICNHWTARTA